MHGSDGTIIFGQDGRGERRWLNELQEAGLVELTDAGFGSAHYKIHEVAWDYMQRFPDRFIHVLAWRGAPWETPFNEAQKEQEIQNHVEV